MNTLFGEQLQVVNVGLPGFAEAIRAAGGTAAQVEWAPPGPGEPLVARRLADLVQHPSIEEANREAHAAYLAAQPVLEGIGPAGRVIPDMGPCTILHAGPPIAWATMCGPSVPTYCRAMSWCEPGHSWGRRRWGCWRRWAQCR